MSNELMVKPDQGFWNEKQMAALKSIGLHDAKPAEMAVFLNYCQRTGLDPFARQIYMIERGGRYTIQASIDGLRIVAQRSGEYAGQTQPMWCDEDGVWVDVWLKNTPPVAAKIGVYRAGFAEPLVTVARTSSYMPLKRDGKTPSGLWAQMPDVMIAKVAEALALRKAFPNDLSGIYTNDEMDKVDAPVTVQHDAPRVVKAEIVATEIDSEAVQRAESVIGEVLPFTLDEETLKQIWFANEDVLDVVVGKTTLRNVIVAALEQVRGAVSA